jgi:hypothetical protein
MLWLQWTRLRSPNSIVTKKESNLNLSHSIQTIVSLHNKSMIHIHNNNNFGSSIYFTPFQFSQTITTVIGSFMLAISESYSPF